MKLVVVDVGNTSTAVGLWSGGRVTRVRHIDGEEAGENAGMISRRTELCQRTELAFAAVEALVPRAEAIAYVSVVPKADAPWRAFARRIGKPLIPITYRDFPLRLDYPKPETIGADRLADAAAAVDRYGAPVLVCDFGTAFTAAAVTADRTWRGGVIAPGLPLMRDYFCARTAKLPRIKLGGRCPVIGRSTEEAMRIGALVGARGMVREIVDHLSRAFDSRFRLVATGGYASWVLKDLDLPFTVDPTLTLHGTGLLAARALGRDGSPSRPSERSDHK